MLATLLVSFFVVVLVAILFYSFFTDETKVGKPHEPTGYSYNQNEHQNYWNSER